MAKVRWDRFQSNSYIPDSHRPCKSFANMLISAAIYAAALLSIIGCGETKSPRVPASQGFSWIVPGELAAMPAPGRDRPLDQDAAFLEQEEIQVLVSLTENPPDAEVLAARSIDLRHIPLKDFTPPTLQQMIEFVAVVENSVAVGKRVGVHCTAGLGRSGTMAAGYLVAEGVSADEAIATVRQLRPGSIETPAQEGAVRSYQDHLDRD